MRKHWLIPSVAELLIPCPLLSFLPPLHIPASNPFYKLLLLFAAYFLSPLHRMQASGRWGSLFCSLEDLELKKISPSIWNSACPLVTFSNTQNIFCVCVASFHSLQDLISPTRIKTQTLPVKMPSPNHWTIRKIASKHFLVNEPL